MDIFHKDGHLTDDALRALICGEELSPLERLEISEHLAFCDVCLQRYTNALSDTVLLVPEHSCQEGLWRRIRARTIRLLTSRYATAAAAVLLALTVLWGSKPSLPVSIPDDTPAHIMETTDTLPQQLNSALETFSGTLRGFFETIGEGRRATEGGLKP